MKIISRPKLRELWDRDGCQDAKQPLLAWFKEVEKAEWKGPADVKRLYRSADLVGDGRVVFNIGGNKYRLVVWVKYGIKLVLISSREQAGEEKMKKLKLKVINTDRDYRRALTAIEELWDAKPGSEEHDALEVLALLVEDYEKRTFPLEEPDPVEAIRFRLEQTGKEPKDLVPILGSRSRVSEVLNRKRSLSLVMIRRLHDALRIPFEALIPADSEAR